MRKILDDPPSEVDLLKKKKFRCVQGSKCEFGYWVRVVQNEKRIIDVTDDVLSGAYIFVLPCGTSAMDDSANTRAGEGIAKR